MRLQVSLAIRGGYVLDKSQTVNTKPGVLGLNKANLSKKEQFPFIICGFWTVNGQIREYQNRK